MYRRPKFLEVLLSIREEMAREADYDVDLFAEMVRADLRPAVERRHSLLDADDGPAAAAPKRVRIKSAKRQIPKARKKP